MRRLALTSLFGLLGLVGVPVLVFVGMLGLASLDDHCQRANSGGCEMAAASFAMVSTVPGLIGGALLGAWLGRPRALGAEGAADGRLAR